MYVLKHVCSTEGVHVCIVCMKAPINCLCMNAFTTHVHCVCLWITGLPYMRCIIGVSNLSSKSWVINHEGREYIYYLKGSLPFSKVSTRRVDGN